MKALKSNSKNKSKESYDSFDQINGSHPLRKATDECYIDYPARKRKGGKLAAFNFDLAREMGLISKDHPDQVNPQLEQKIIDTFSIVIINEYDQINDLKVPKEELKPGAYMATRYLQLQHPNKQGKTSGDGRSIWNGHFKGGGRTWDISSCGTGATRLSPATHIKHRFFQTGDPTISYGCGYSELDESLATLFFSEILYKNGFNTERLLAIIEFKNDISIAVRVNDNLLRPSHLFNHLKQKNYDSLEALVHYYIDRQVSNKVWSDCPKETKARLDYFLTKQIEVFATLAANFEDEYIFCWLDWDGDNVLMDGGIIDYGSVRQFGLFHAEYRFDDVDRYSTSILEQKQKAKDICQVFVQLVDFVKTGKWKCLSKFRSSRELKRFNKIFQETKDKNLIKKMGFKDQHVDYLFENHRPLIKKLRSSFSYFERANSIEGLHEVADGINVNAIFCMRDILRELPQLYLSRGEKIKKSEFIEILKSNYATEEDLVITSYRSSKIADFQRDYWKIVKKVAGHFEQPENKVLLELTMRSSVINKYDRVTGDSITTIVDKLMSHRPKLGAEEMYSILKDFTEFQNLDPDTKRHIGPDAINHNKLVQGMLEIVRDFREGL